MLLFQLCCLISQLDAVYNCAEAQSVEYLFGMAARISASIRRSPCYQASIVFDGCKGPFTAAKLYHIMELVANLAAVATST